LSIYTFTNETHLEQINRQGRLWEYRIKWNPASLQLLLSAYSPLQCSICSWHLLNM
jgi:hypothetical protein